MPTANIQLANNLRFLRKKCGLNQQVMEKILNISRQAYSNYERCERTPDLDTLVRLSLFYQVSIDDLILKDLHSTDNLPLFGGMKETPASYYSYAECKENNCSIYLTEQELDFISSFRALSKESKQIVTGFLKNS